MTSVGQKSGAGLAAAVSVVAVLLAPAANADGQSPSYLQGKQAIDEQVLNLHVQLGDTFGLDRYCKTLLQNALRTGQILKVDSPSDFVAGCQDEGRALVASH
ncbi:hypothetical protein B5M45_30915 [Mycobacterium simiae]|uniref:DUF732 domain-containing protein n=1 Tax=Mycobacterium simiae TaxID=1784 RepID=A0A1X0XI86_MYCSI|nr:hypothetical protein B5M45_30915 [Mycobacterium simiae]